MNRYGLIIASCAILLVAIAIWVKWLPNAHIEQAVTKDRPDQQEAARTDYLDKDARAADKLERALVKTTLVTMVDGKRNAFFDEKKLVTQFLVEHPNAVELIAEFLNDTAQLQTLSVSTSIIEERPRVVLERMAAIDLLAQATSQEKDRRVAELATKTLETIVLSEVDTRLMNAAKKVLLAEKYDCLRILARLDPQRAPSVLSEIAAPPLRAMLREAAIAGLVESGMSHDDATELLN